MLKPECFHAESIRTISSVKMCFGLPQHPLADDFQSAFRVAEPLRQPGQHRVDFRIFYRDIQFQFKSLPFIIILL